MADDLNQTDTGTQVQPESEATAPEVPATPETPVETPQESEPAPAPVLADPTPVVGSENPDAETAVGIQTFDTGNAAVNASIGQWAEETALSFINLIDIPDVRVRRASVTHLKEEDLEIMISVAQSYINLQNFYAIETGNLTISEAAKKNQGKLVFLKKWIGI